MIDRPAVHTPEWRTALSDAIGKSLENEAGEPQDVVEWGGRNFYTQEPAKQLIRWQPHQPPLLRYMFQKLDNGQFRFRTILYSTVKKSGKTAIAGLVGQWAADDAATWGANAEIYSLANDLEQAQGRIFKAITRSVEAAPRWEDHWQTSMKVVRNLDTGSEITAVSGDYRGAAGGNPTLTLWSELWGFTDESAIRLWDEMKPSPARKISIRFVETYRGFRHESELLQDLEDLALEGGHQITMGELMSVTGCDVDAFSECSSPSDLVPIWINEVAGVCAYVDEEEVARRMPWQTPQYYAEEEATERTISFERHHLNRWVDSEESAFPEEWWDACVDPMPLDDDDKTTPIILSLDAGISKDSFAGNALSRHPEHADHVVQRARAVWTPPKKGKKIDFDGPREWVRDMVEKHNVVQVAYDPYQLHDFMTNLKRELGVWCREFSQQGGRLIADGRLYHLVQTRRIHLLGDPESKDHAMNANVKIPKDEDTRMRFVKKGPGSQIDLLVALSMGSHECLRLNIAE